MNIFNFFRRRSKEKRYIRCRVDMENKVLVFDKESGNWVALSSVLAGRFHRSEFDLSCFDSSLNARDINSFDQPCEIR